MASLNRVMIIGRLGRDPEVKYTAAGTAVASFSVAISEKYKNKSGETEEKTEWVNCTLWGRLAEIAGEYLGKGKEVYLEGRISTRKWQDKDGKDRYSTEVIGEKMQMLGSRGGGQSGGDSSAGSSGGNSGGGGPTYEEKPIFNPDDDIPFMLPAHYMA